MREKFLRLILVIISLSICISAFSQENIRESKPDVSIVDSLRNIGLRVDKEQERPEIVLSTDQAMRFLEEKYQIQNWNNPNDPLRLAIGHLIFEASNPPLDSSKYLLDSFPWDSLNIPWKNFYVWDSINLKIPYLLPMEFTIQVDSINKADSNVVGIVSDSLNPELLTLPDPFKSAIPLTSLKDTTIRIIVDTLNKVVSTNSEFPFRYANFPYQGDSIKVAVKSLVTFLEVRDSSVINFTGLGNKVTTVWMNSKSDKMMRYWLKNEFSDSVTVWIGTISRDTIGLYLEQGVNFRRPPKQGNISEAKINLESLDNSKLLDVQKIVVKHQYWIYRSEASIALTQASLTNWVKGGESSFSSSMDITGYADYNNKSLKVSMNNFARMKLGFLASGDKGFRKNLDLLETNSKLNHKAFGKFDFSGILLFKTQVAPGYNYPNDSVMVSKFMNPAILTVGFGLDYKPNKETSINFSPFSYKGTFVPDTLNIDQTKYGILKNRRSKNEPGASFMISHVFNPFKTVNVTNRLQLFTNYINNPQNIDVDWEMIVVAKLNWFTDVRFNTHLIFDDDTKTAVLDKNGDPIIENGVQKKTARVQFKQMLGVSFVFRF